MTFTDYANKSVHELRVLVQLDIGSKNLQWVNTGAGIWYCDYFALYPEVDSSLLTGFTAQDFGSIGSVSVDAVPYISMSTLLDISSVDGSFFYDGVAKKIYIHFINNTDPYLLNNILFGAIYGFSYDEFTPVGADILYQGRLQGSLSIGESRDPLYFGKISYDFGNLSFINSDGYFDNFPALYNLYGNEIRILVGYADLDYSQYVTIFSATVEKFNITETEANISVADKRKKLSKAVTYTCTAKSALVAIRELLATHYNAQYTSAFYDMAEWGAAELTPETVTIDIDSGKAIQDKPVIDIIEMICASIFGLFKINAEGKYGFKIVNASDPAVTSIPKYDIFNSHSIDYDPTEVISSAKVGYAKSWVEGYTSPYTFYTNTSQEARIFEKYKVYNQKQFDTVLVTNSEAVNFSNTILEYARDVHGMGNVTIPLKYYYLQIGDMVDIEIARESTTMLGLIKCEVLAKSYNLDNGTIDLRYRITSDVNDRATTYGDDRVTTDGFVRRVGA